MRISQERESLLSELKAKNPDWGRVLLSRESGIHPSAVQRWLKKQELKHKSSVVGDYSLQVPKGHRVKGVSTLYGPNGELKGQWVKSAEDSAEKVIEFVRDAIEELLIDVKGKSEIVENSGKGDEDLIVVYPITDAHIGLYSWDEETGSNFDVDIAKKNLLGLMRHLVDASPRSELCLIPNLADFFHTDTSENRTLRSGNVLDVDTRQARVFREGVKCYREMINMALEKHSKVVVLSSIGNHDDHSILALAMVMQAYFDNNERVQVDLPINPFSYYQFGKNLFGFNHGTVKSDRLAAIMPADQPKAWGDTEYRTWMTGHNHTESVKCYPGVKVEGFNATCAPDSWAHSSGYRSVRDMQAIFFHKEEGEVGRIRRKVKYI